MRTSTPPTTFLKDYRPAPYYVPQVRLAFVLDEEATRVTSTLFITPQADTVAGTPLVLDGEKLTLTSIALNGVALAPSDYEQGEERLVLHNPPATSFTLKLETTCNPRANTELSGLYLSNGMYCTQCEAEGFRRITYFPDRPDVMAQFDVRIEAPTSLPVLLSNGNPGQCGTLAGGWHFAEWHDPFPKPSYLFALVAGDLDSIHHTFTTLEGRSVRLAIYVERGKADRCAWAMESLKRSMAWDETRFGCAYDLDVFNIVAVSHFNMGAMENKGLNIFNDKYILASAETATDLDYANIEAIVAHEYFHNWTGNRITCRDWFQLCLKEGLTVYRDQEFTADMRSRPVKRISDVRTLRARQFPEDGGPLAHPVRPDRYIEINNFYTPTVYEKGAEICRMLALLVGEELFRAGMDLYFKRHDGEAVTIEDFLACFADASGRDLSQFHSWYEQAGTPHVVAQGDYNAADRSYTLTVEQRTPPTPGQDSKRPLHMPLRIGLLGKSGTDLALGNNAAPDAVIELTEARQTFRFRNIPERPVLSLNRGFSAPIILSTNATADDELFAMAHDTDSFNRWQAVQARALALFTTCYAGRGDDAALGAFAAALAKPLMQDDLEAAYRSLLLALPSEADVAAAIGREVNAARIRETRSSVLARIGSLLATDLHALWQATAAPSLAYQPDAAQAGRRALRYAVLPYLLRASPAEGEALARLEFASVRHMTGRMGTLSALAQTDLPFRDEAFSTFHAGAARDPLMIDKWFMLQAQCRSGAEIAALTRHADFTFSVPNRVHALLSTFMSANMAGFHASDGTGYSVIADAILTTDKTNPQLAARLATGLRSWRMFDGQSREHAEHHIMRVLRQPGLSRDCYEITSRIAAAT